MIRSSVTYPSGVHYSVELDEAGSPSVKGIRAHSYVHMQYKLPDGYEAMSLTLSSEHARILAYKLLVAVAESAPEER